MKIPVYSRYGVEFVDPIRAAMIASAENAEVVRARNHRVVQINLLSYGDDHNHPSQHGNSRKFIRDTETETNPPRVYELKKQHIWHASHSLKRTAS